MSPFLRLWLTTGWLLGLSLVASRPVAAQLARATSPPDTAAHWLAAAPGAARTAALLRVAYRYAAHMNEQARPYAEAARRAARAAHDPVAEGEACNALGRYWQMAPINPDSARPWLLRAQRLLTQGPPAAQARNSLYLLDLYNANPQATAAQRTEARRFYRQGVRQARAAHSPELLGKLEVCWSQTCAGRGRADSALYLARQAAQRARQQHLPVVEATALGVVAKMLSGNRDLSQADYYAQQALALQRRYDPAGEEVLTAIEMLDLLSTNCNAKQRHQHRRALYYLQAQRQLVQRYHVANQLPNILLQQGHAYHRLGPLDSAVAAHRLGLRLLAGMPAAVRYLRLHHQAALAWVLADQGHLAEAQRLATQALDTSSYYHLVGPQRNAVVALGAVARQQGDFALALRLAEQQYALQDTMSQGESQRLMQEMRARFNTDRAEAQVLGLTRERELAELRSQRRLLGLGLGLMLVAGLAGAGALAFRRRQQRREQALRARLAADLHDDVGALLTRISMESSLLSEGLHPPAEQHQHLHNLMDVSRQALRQMSDVVWSVKSDDSLPGVLSRMREHGYELLATAGLELDLRLPAEVEQAPLPAAARQHLYLIYKEALHNAVKHARGAEVVTVQLALTGTALLLTVHDDGAGTLNPGRPQGNGLRNMRHRAEAVGGTVEYVTAPGQGFTVRACLPLARRWRPEWAA